MRDDYGLRQESQNRKRFHQDVFGITDGNGYKMKKGGRRRQDKTPHLKERRENIRREIITKK